MSNATMKCGTHPDGTKRHEIHVDGVPRGFVTEDQLREYAIRHLAFTPKAVPAQRVVMASAGQLFNALAQETAKANGITDREAMLVIAQTPEGQFLWELKREAELAESARDAEREQERCREANIRLGHGS